MVTTTLEATVPCLAPPSWAILERKLLEVLSQSVYPFLEKYTHETPFGSHTLDWQGQIISRDGADDFYESFYNWPLLYLLGGEDHLLDLSIEQWETTTRQLTALGLVEREYELGYDQFHQGESYLYFYFLCLADPTNSKLLERARKFAGFYLNEDVSEPNYDPQLKLIKAPHNGSGGPRWGYIDGDPLMAVGHWPPEMKRYGLPYHDVTGISEFSDLNDPNLARQLGEVMQWRMGRGDVAVNLITTSLVTNAYLLTGEEKYRQWVIEYVDQWVDRAYLNGGLLPDNVGLSGQVGEYVDGKWYGGLYGWTWPHGFYSVGAATIVAASNALLVTHNPAYLELPRNQIDRVVAQGQVLSLDKLEEMSLEHHWVGQRQALQMEGTTETFVVPYRYSDKGWFDYQPLTLQYPVVLWYLSMEERDHQQLKQLEKLGNYSWQHLIPFRNKEDAGHESPWLTFLNGNNPTYPADFLAENYGQVCRRLAQIRQDQTLPDEITNIHHWQELNPVLTEALVQLTLGAPQPIYNGGLLMCRVRYFDPLKRRPGLPSDVAALVEKLEANRTILQLVNISPFEKREVIIQGGAFGEHQIVSVSYSALDREYHDPIGSFAADQIQPKMVNLSVNEKWIKLVLPPATEIRLELEMACFVNRPSYSYPWTIASSLC